MKGVLLIFIIISVSNAALEGTWKDYVNLSISGTKIYAFVNWSCSTRSGGLFLCVRSFLTFAPIDTRDLSPHEKKLLVRIKQNAEPGDYPIAVKLRLTETKEISNSWYDFPGQKVGAVKILWPEVSLMVLGVDVKIRTYWIKQGIINTIQSKLVV